MSKYRFKRLSFTTPAGIGGTDQMFEINIDRPSIILRVGFGISPDGDVRQTVGLPPFQSGKCVGMPDFLNTQIFASSHIDYTDLEVSGLVQFSAGGFPSGYPYPDEEGEDISAQVNTLFVYVLESI
jgi:hypothetical protein